MDINAFKISKFLDFIKGSDWIILHLPLPQIISCNKIDIWGGVVFHWVDDLLICVEDVLLIMCKKTLNSKQISK